MLANVFQVNDTHMMAVEEFWKSIDIFDEVTTLCES